MNEIKTMPKTVGCLNCEFSTEDIQEMKEFERVGCPNCSHCEECDNGTDTPCTACLWNESAK